MSTLSSDPSSLTVIPSVCVSDQLGSDLKFGGSLAQYPGEAEGVDLFEDTGGPCLTPFVVPSPTTLNPEERKDEGVTRDFQRGGGSVTVPDPDL